MCDGIVWVPFFFVILSYARNISHNVSSNHYSQAVYEAGIQCHNLTENKFLIYMKY